MHLLVEKPVKSPLVPTIADYTLTLTNFAALSQSKSSQTSACFPLKVSLRLHSKNHTSYTPTHYFLKIVETMFCNCRIQQK